MWGFVDGKPLVHRVRRLKELPARSREPDALSKELIRRGFRFVGSTICYAHMQATGMVNDHLLSCFRHAKTVWPVRTTSPRAPLRNKSSFRRMREANEWRSA